MGFLPRIIEEVLLAHVLHGDEDDEDPPCCAPLGGTDICCQAPNDIDEEDIFGAEHWHAKHVAQVLATKLRGDH